MKCGSSECSCPEFTTTYPCVVCGLGVHHLCNDLYDAGKLSECSCSADCVYKWKTANSPPSKSEMESREPLDSSSQTSLASGSQDAILRLGQPTQFESPPSPAPAVDLTATSDTSSSSSRCSASASGVDAFAIPFEVCHYRQENCRHEVWDVGHRLETPYTKLSGTDMKPFTHVCLMCAQQLTRSPERVERCALPLDQYVKC
ncbi:hypothetical protein PC129_g7726 [Phytophthora cactorum]|uniref:Uncharacterized protein n=1 Tax=Phytophthora cactorum TaxID=29920 RepID=A0A329RFD5_9STRA|nr:hypothetical protein Pcac1_g12988 [Phytophthora cactorum]KAG2825058.1 hypothetical protein PC112_g9852 [Phytophthora cactorum]KAG2826950.1 hypothetical protein PC111_g8764 [Phytophthora cactorum]KAG2858042.1 hypothetical protein PC113_g10136 [Phytophthora cactorum]KAG2907888.1 hypothetical protein PC114_g10680 [Phytophthora cactorum]